MSLEAEKQLEKYKKSESVFKAFIIALYGQHQWDEPVKKKGQI